MIPLRVLIKGLGDDGRGDQSDDEAQRRGGGEHADETNAHVDPLLSRGSCQLQVHSVRGDAHSCRLGKARPALLFITIECHAAKFKDI
jgi:hypothetical protein